MSTIEKDFDRLALLDSEGWTQNNHYHNFLLRHVPKNSDNVLEIGCGTGAFARRLAERAQHVTAIDLSSEMIRVARSRSVRFPNIDYQLADAAVWDFPAKHFNCVVAIATLHHLKLREILIKMKSSLRAEGVLLVLDLFEPEGSLFKFEGWQDIFANVIAVGVSGSLRLIHNGRLKPPPVVQAAWEDHGQHDSYPTLSEIRALCSEFLPGATIRKQLLWRYSIVWKKRL